MKAKIVEGIYTIELREYLSIIKRWLEGRGWGETEIEEWLGDKDIMGEIKKAFFERKNPIISVKDLIPVFESFSERVDYEFPLSLIAITGLPGNVPLYIKGSAKIQEEVGEDGVERIFLGLYLSPEELKNLDYNLDSPLLLWRDSIPKDGIPEEILLEEKALYDLIIGSSSTPPPKKIDIEDLNELIYQ